MKKDPLLQPKKLAQALKLHEKNAAKNATRGHKHVAKQEREAAERIEKLLSAGGYDKNGRSTL